MIEYSQEKVSTLWGEVMPLLEAHWDEIAHYKDILVDPDTALYEMVEEAGALRCYTARADGRLIGYLVFFVKHNGHYKSSLQAVQDVLFLLPQYRKGGVGVRLLKWAEEMLIAENVQVVYHHVKTTNQVGKLLVHLGYELVDEIYAKRLDKGVE